MAENGIPNGFVSVADAADMLRQTESGVTKRLRAGTLAGKKVPRGRRLVWAVDESALPNAAAQRETVAQLAPVGADEGDLAERNSVLHEVLRRRRIIDEHQATIDRCRVLIDEQRSEIEALLLGAPAIPNN